ncbi:MAG: tripartite tricarboxylate transporter substrate-binding protein [Pseudotabrizicola sp.]|uniref:Bug family tripartite tricarboxylate transporter substrate binding protein n=1 Tax=Pseudotabrizicola sp. TaxID=2939647 RepID=UPI00272826EF|nr:tripartite tricarboxylate transporter substrate-binding protein [Pseudotabrizicola sp.]MDO8881836.1 tripartite tricarboxylate transporter substrate-binding protein [Pseudotabrizicola sp.]MDP2079741.1 tripartite tricarboxylate transporter substrate-binding protein [Pseudotabrizicola sp.]MDZ7574742.1 tripartite tricarboxylate transporter substrate-binding protein [Pseudotabrizicola sp.]
MRITVKALAFSATALMGMTTSALATECIAPANPGGGWDFTCRQIANIMQEIGLSSNMVQVTNMAGAGGGVAYTHVVGQRNTDADVFIAASSATTTRLAQNAFAGMTADQVRWVGTIGGDPGVIVVAKDSPFQTINDLVEAVKTDPAKVAFAGGSAVGGFDHLKVLMLLDRAGYSEARSVKYIGLDGGADAITQTVGGFTQAMTGDISEIQGFIRSGDVRALAVLSDERVAGFEDIPTAKEQGIDMVAMNWRGIYVPKGISDDDFAKWTDALQKVADSEQWQKVMTDNGLAPYTLIGADFEKFVNDNIAEVTEISKEIGIIQ